MTLKGGSSIEYIQKATQKEERSQHSVQYNMLSFPNKSTEMP